MSAAICSLGMNQAANLAAFATYLGWTVEQVSPSHRRIVFLQLTPANVAYPRGTQVWTNRSRRMHCSWFQVTRLACLPVRLWGHRIRPCRIRDRSHRHLRRPRQQRAVGTPCRSRRPRSPKRRVPQMPGS